MELSASPFGVIGLFYSQRPSPHPPFAAAADVEVRRPQLWRESQDVRAVGKTAGSDWEISNSETVRHEPVGSGFAISTDQLETGNACSPAELLRLVQALMAPATRSSDLDSPAEAAAIAFTRAAQDIEAQRRQGGLTPEQSAEKTRAAWDEFEEASRLVRLKVVAQPDGCTLQWRPLFGGQWTAMSGDGALVGIGVNQVRVFRDGFTPVVENVTTDTDLTRTYRLAPTTD